MLVIHFFIIIIIFFLFIYVFICLFLTAMCQVRMCCHCFFKKLDGLYVIPANWLLLIVIDSYIRQEKQLWILF